ncbi:P27 family phage terminase small subunit (plasmid) [Paracoccus versutus]|uniref:P27 family predicted phage terminase small subunit n=1 Tax=Paracoccus versutus TaxID=34007 RepID=A0AAQ0HBG6_PARVE|nr:P27 family phage terminase small subunit [Paracoccus versutus]KGJ01760.1 terminase [Paracoccus versutus]REG26344.1 P27 family predicted phage terminase small subunit [Paracoccus versutus]WEJ80956.1 P27 family phage terminase small subunit [Paracoccus versutus]
MSKHLRGVKPAVHPDQEPLTKAPKAPAYFSPYAVQEWKRILPMLIARKLICKADLGLVEDLCIARGYIRQIETERKQAGGVIDKVTFGILNRAILSARQLAANLGLDPVSRARLGAAPDQPDPNARPNPLSFRR